MNRKIKKLTLKLDAKRCHGLALEYYFNTTEDPDVFMAFARELRDRSSKNINPTNPAYSHILNRRIL